MNEETLNVCDKIVAR